MQTCPLSNGHQKQQKRRSSSRWWWWRWWKKAKCGILNVSTSSSRWMRSSSKNGDLTIIVGNITSTAQYTVNDYDGVAMMVSSTTHSNNGNGSQQAFCTRYAQKSIFSDHIPWDDTKTMRRKKFIHRRVLRWAADPNSTKSIQQTA